MNIAGIDYESIKDGDGVRTVIYVSGCSHNCCGCHNSQAHNADYGIPFTKALQEEIIDNINKRPFISGLTWSGGDPLHENTLDDVLDFTNEFRRLYSDAKTIWLYTGYTWDKVMNHVELPDDDDYGYYFFLENEQYEMRKEIISGCDVMVDGRFVQELADINYRWAGSTNQRVIDIRKSLENNNVAIWEN